MYLDLLNNINLWVECTLYKIIHFPIFGNNCSKLVNALDSWPRDTGFKLHKRNKWKCESVNKWFTVINYSSNRRMIQEMNNYKTDKQHHYFLICYIPLSHSIQAEFFLHAGAWVSVRLITGDIYGASAAGTCNYGNPMGHCSRSQWGIPSRQNPSQWRIQGGGTPGVRPPPLRTKIFLISCSFSENLANLYAGAPLLEDWRPLLWEILDPPLLPSCRGISFGQVDHWPQPQCICSRCS